MISSIRLSSSNLTQIIKFFAHKRVYLMPTVQRLYYRIALLKSQFTEAKVIELIIISSLNVLLLLLKVFKRIS